MIDIIINPLILIGITILTTEMIAMPIYITIFECGGGRSFTEVWPDYQKHNLRVLRRLFINDLTKCPRCGSISVEHVPGQWWHCLKCTYLIYDKEVKND